MEEETQNQKLAEAIAEVADELLRRHGEKERIQPDVGGPLRPADPTIREEDIDRANARFDDLLPEFAGLLAARVAGSKGMKRSLGDLIGRAKSLFDNFLGGGNGELDLG